MLCCAECGPLRTAEAVGWRAFLTSEPDAEAAVLCPGRAEREFGPPGLRFASRFAEPS